MTTPSDLDAQWCAEQDAIAVGDRSRDDATDHGHDPRWDAEDSFYTDLQTFAETPVGVEAADAALIDAVMGDEAAMDNDLTPPAERGRVVWLSAGLFAAAAAALLVWWASSALSTPQAFVDQGEWVAQRGGAPLHDGDAMPQAVWLVADADACGSIEAAVVCATEGTVVRMSPPKRGSIPEIELASGSVTVTQGRWTVLAGDTARTLVAGESFSFDEVTDVEKGAKAPIARLQGTASEPDQAEAGESTAEPAAPVASTKARPRPSPRADPGTMLSAARRLRGAGKNTKAAHAYAALLSAHPKSAEANAARVSLGQLRLEAGRAKAALALFNKYLARGGALAEEALWGKIKALHAMHRKRDLGRAVAELERRFPRSVYLSRAKDRAGQ